MTGWLCPRSSTVMAIIVKNKNKWIRLLGKRISIACDFSECGNAKNTNIFVCSLNWRHSKLTQICWIFIGNITFIWILFNFYTSINIYSDFKHTPVDHSYTLLSHIWYLPESTINLCKTLWLSTDPCGMPICQTIITRHTTVNGPKYIYLKGDSCKTATVYSIKYVYDFTLYIYIYIYHKSRILV